MEQMHLYVNLVLILVFVAGNAYGPIVNTPAGAAVNGSSAASSLSTTDANANFSY